MKTKIEYEKYEEKILIKYSRNLNEIEKNDYELDIYVVNYELEKIILILEKVINKKIKKYKSLDETSIFINFNPGSSRIEIKFQRLIKTLFFNTDKEINELITLKESLSEKIEEFEKGTKDLKLRKFKKQEYEKRETYDSYGITTKIYEKGELIWEGDSLTLELIKIFLAKPKLKKANYFSTKALINHDEINASLISSNLNNKDMLKEIKKIYTIDIKEKIEENEKEIIKLDEMKKETKIIENFKMNVENLTLSKSNFNDDDRKATIIPWGSLNSKTFNINLGKSKPKIGNKNYIEAKVEIEYDSGNIEKIVILKIIHFEINVEELNMKDSEKDYWKNLSL